MRDENVGSTVQGGKLHHLSVSSLEKADPQTDGGCYRKFFFDKVLHVETVNQYQAAMDAGTALHGEIEKYLKTGENALGTLAMKGLHFIPSPGEDLHVEEGFHFIDYGVLRSPLTAANVPLVGYIDLWHTRALTVDGDGRAVRDPDGRIEVIDWKRKGSAKDRNGTSTFKRPEQLIRTIQMAGYGELHRRLGASHVRLSHGYFPASGGLPQKVTNLHASEEFEKPWRYVEAVARVLVDVAKETEISKVPANVNACGAYGGCPYRSRCPAGHTSSLSSLFGETAKGEIMGLLSQLGAPAPTTNSPQYDAAMTVAYGPADASASADTRAQLLAEEARLRAQQQALDANAAILGQMRSAWCTITSSGRGTPTLGGEAAKAYASAHGMTAAIGYAGSGQLGQLNLMDPAHILQLASELSGTPIAPAAPIEPVVFPPIAGILPPDAPESNPALASKGPEVATQEVPAKKRGRPKASDVKELVSEVASEPPAATFPEIRGKMPVADPDSTLSVYVDCVPSCEYENLHPYIDRILFTLAQKYCVDGQGKPTLQDIRCAPQDGQLGFGKWKGAVHALVREAPPPNKAYYLDTRGNEISEVVADAMRVVVSIRGGIYVRGQR